MPPTDAVLLPLCIGLTVLGLLVTILAGQRGRRGRVVQGAGLTLAPLALYLSGLLGLLWNGGVALVRWIAGVIPSPTVWAGLGLLGVSVVLWVVGGLIAARSPGRTRSTAAEKSVTKGGAGAPAMTAGSRPATARAPQATAQGRQQPPVDDDMAEIEALLKSRGIE